MKASATESGYKAILVLSAAFFAVVTATSLARWANFEYRTFDLAYYVQAIWQLIHGRFDVTVEPVPLLGNHVEPIVFLFAPLLAIFRHPLVFVVGQNLALASMGPVGYAIARRLGFEARGALLLGSALLVAPATSYVALHEFHPEALTAPFLLCLLHARIAGWRRRYWLWFIAVLACKENMALLLSAYCLTHIILERRKPWRESLLWNGWPLLAAVGWFALCTFVITPAFNSGNIDYVTLYDRLGSSPIEIVRNIFVRPQLIGNALLQSLWHGNLVWGLLVPFLALPLLRPRWLLISTPILLQHLLSWRSSEWNIYFHYAAPLLPLFWIGAVEAIVRISGVDNAEPSNKGTRPGLLQSWIPAAAMLLACLIAQVFLGPMPVIGEELGDWPNKRTERERKHSFLDQIPPNASAVAGLPYLSHLAMREKIYSLHYILKGLKTLSHASYEPPPPTDYVFIDYNDVATFDAGAGYYHPAMKTRDDRVVPSSDALLANFFRAAPAWTVTARDEFALFHRSDGAATNENSGSPDPSPIFTLADGTKLLGVSMNPSAAGKTDTIQIALKWQVADERRICPWLTVRISKEGKTFAVLTKGMCAPEAQPGITTESWQITWPPADLPPGQYELEAMFWDNPRRAWVQANRQANVQSILLTPAIGLGQIRAR